MLRSIRGFFDGREYLEVETPVRLRAPALELHIDAEPSGDHYLRTSPELHMKRLLAAGYHRIYQIGPCFRQGERGRLHHPEYSMLEWYRAGTDYLGVLKETRDMLRRILQESGGEAAGVDTEAEWPVLSVEEVFLEYAGWSPVRDWDPDRFDLDLTGKIEPQLPRGVPVVLKDYPAPVAALARLKPGRPEVAERWELYLGGVELANAYSELTAAEEQAERFEACARQRRAAGKESYPLDEAFLAALRCGMPPAGGVALGIDRLVMLLCGAENLDDVLPFRNG